MEALPEEPLPVHERGAVELPGAQARGAVLADQVGAVALHAVLGEGGVCVEWHIAEAQFPIPDEHTTFHCETSGSDWQPGALE